MNPSAQPRQPARSSLLPLLGAGACFWAAHHLYQINLAGQDGAGLGALVCGALGMSGLLRGLNALTVRRRVRHAEKDARRVSDTHGVARWADRKDLKRDGCFQPGGFFLGALKGKDVYAHIEGSHLIFAPPGSGKGTTSAIPNLLIPHRDEHGRLTSIFVLDIKGELYSVTHRAMETHGYQTKLLCPWAKSMSEVLGVPMTDAGFNPTIGLLAAGDETKDYAEMLAELLLPTPKNMSGSSEHFLTWGRELLVWALLVLALEADPVRMNFVEVRRVLMASAEEFNQLLAATSESDAFGGALAEVANKCMNTYENAGEEWSGAVNTATRALKNFDGFGPVGRSVSVTDGLDFTTLKTTPTVVYLCIPAERVTTHQLWLNLVLAMAIEQLGRDRTNRRVLCLFDEFGNVTVPNIMKALGLYRGQGLQFALYAQTGVSQIREKYGEDGLRNMLSMMECIQAFGVRDADTNKTLSALAGQRTVKEFSQNLNPDINGEGRVGFSASASNQARPLIRPEEIRTLPADKSLVFLGNQQPMLLDKVSYLDRKRWRDAADPNPYHRGDDDVS